MKRNNLFKLLLIIIIFVLLGNGCTYMHNRARDAMDIVDLGLTFSKKPQIGLYIDFFNITPIGYSDYDATYFGWGHRQAGLLESEDHSWGVLFWGQEKAGIGEFNPKNPRQARADQRDAEDPPVFNAGVVRHVAENNHPPVQHFFECNRALHLGWIGFHNTMRPLEIVDFILGWTTIDISNDDNIHARE